MKKRKHKIFGMQLKYKIHQELYSKCIREVDHRQHLIFECIHKLYSYDVLAFHNDVSEFIDSFGLTKDGLLPPITMEEAIEGTLRKKAAEMGVDLDGFPNE